VLLNVTQYQDVRNAPASWNSSAYSTATLQLTVTNTSVAAFDNVTQTALLNAINSYLVADGYNNTYLGLSSISVSPPSTLVYIVAIAISLRANTACLQTDSAALQMHPSMLLLVGMFPQVICS